MAAFVWVFFHRPNKENSMVHLFFHLSQSNKHSFQKQDFLEFLIFPLFTPHHKIGLIWYNYFNEIKEIG